MCFPKLKISLINIPILVPFIAFPMALIIIPFSLIDSIIDVFHYSFSLPDQLSFSILYAFPKIHSIRKFLYGKIYWIPNLLYVNHTTLRNILIQNCLNIFCCLWTSLGESLKSEIEGIRLWSQRLFVKYHNGFTLIVFSIVRNLTANIKLWVYTWVSQMEHCVGKDSYSHPVQHSWWPETWGSHYSEVLQIIF